MTAKGRETVRGWWVTIARTPDRWQEWNASAQLELERIQKTLNQISQSLES